MAKFTYSDIVRARSSAGLRCRPGERAWVIAVIDNRCISLCGNSLPGSFTASSSKMAKRWTSTRTIWSPQADESLVDRGWGAAVRTGLIMDKRRAEIERSTH
jgi:hypothetical protein